MISEWMLLFFKLCSSCSSLWVGLVQCLPMYLRRLLIIWMLLFRSLLAYRRSCGQKYTQVDGIGWMRTLWSLTCIRKPYSSNSLYLPNHNHMYPSWYRNLKTTSTKWMRYKKTLPQTSACTKMIQSIRSNSKSSKASLLWE